ncbi:MAG: DNA-directed RNA polymerase subunit H [Thermoprotei archaeon]|nr:MAG: DNA-directed RNA polymerase subunit H [Thermoprotei archaeon]RLF00352.1 MAG: DNA-directed RNA polymerase subunit H [Thermoprotei archaeon]HDI75414.1 DNA-directed RNA polymerase subunit H [Thermoprotei archaeon]
MVKKINIFKHEYVPKHILLSKEEAKALLKRMGLKRYDLPWIRASDPAARALGAKPGDVIAIIRKSPTSGEAIALRLVVPG